MGGGGGRERGRKNAFEGWRGRGMSPFLTRPRPHSLGLFLSLRMFGMKVQARGVGWMNILGEKDQRHGNVYSGNDLDSLWAMQAPAAPKSLALTAASGQTKPKTNKGGKQVVPRLEETPPARSDYSRGPNPYHGYVPLLTRK